MSNSGFGTLLLFLMWLITIIISIGSGVMAWNWIAPESFLGGIGFILLWGLLSKVGHLFAVGIIAIFAK